MAIKLKYAAWLLAASLSFAACDDPKDPDPIVPTTNKEDNLGLGNPSNATNSTSNSENYLISKPQFALSYNNTTECANWVSWHLSSDWKGTAVRQNNFISDPDIPASWWRATTSAYTGTNFDRGHICPSDDRDGTQTDNDATFYLSNIAPQNPQLNRYTWAALEDYARKLVTQGYECYIVAGVEGQGGQNGDATDNTYYGTLSNGHVTIPRNFWKVLLAIPVGTNDLSRITSNMRSIAVIMPNTKASGANHAWGDYRVTIDEVETLTGYNFFSKLPGNVQAALESRVDTGPTQ
jgi:endonuclease G, mitochondrial